MKTTKLSLIAMLFSILLFNSCGNADGELDSTVDQEVDATQQNTVLFGVDWVGNVHLKNGAGNFCAQAYGNVLSTNTCDNNNADQLFAIYKMRDGGYNLCKRGLTYKKDDILCLHYYGSTCDDVMVGHSAVAECLYLANFSKNLSPKDYRFSRSLLAWARQNPNGTYSAWENTDSVITLQGQYLKTGKHFMTRNSGMVVVPDNYAGTTSQQWTWY